MRNHLVLLIAKYCRIVKAMNRLKCRKALRSSVFSTLNKLRHSLDRLDKAMRGESVKFKSGYTYGPKRLSIKLIDMGYTVLPLLPVSHIIKTI